MNQSDADLRPRRRAPLGAARLATGRSALLVSVLGFSALGRLTRASEQPLPVLGRVADFALVDQASAPVSRGALAGEPWVANFVFTRCPPVCPRLTRADARRAGAGAAATPSRSGWSPSASIRSTTQPAVLKSLRRRATAPTRRRWKFLTGSEASIEAIARSFSVALDGEADPRKADFGIMHSGHLILVDGGVGSAATTRPARTASSREFSST